MDNNPRYRWGAPGISGGTSKPKGFAVLTQHSLSLSEPPRVSSAGSGQPQSQPRPPAPQETWQVAKTFAGKVFSRGCSGQRH